MRIATDGVLFPSYMEGFADIEVHRSMVEDKIRIEKFAQAITKQVRKDDVVLDIGTGSGVLSFLACQAGARRVYAIEEHENILATARREAKLRGLQDKIVFVVGNSKLLPTEAIPEKVDVVLSETIGVFGIDEGVLANLEDAKRFAKAGNAFIPRSVASFLIPFQFPEKLASGMLACPIPVIPARLFSELGGHSFLSQPQRLFTVDSHSWGTKQLSSEVQFEITSSGEIHGLCGWFEAELAEGVILTTSPYEHETIWGQIIFKLRPPLRVEAREVLTLGFNAVLEEKYTLILMKLKNQSTKELARFSWVCQY